MSNVQKENMVKGDGNSEGSQLVPKRKKNKVRAVRKVEIQRYGRRSELSPEKIEFIERLGRNIKHLRNSAGITQPDLGACVGVAYNAILRAERGVNEPRLINLVRICDVFQVELDLILLQEIGRELPFERFRADTTIRPPATLIKTIERYGRQRKVDSTEFQLHESLRSNLRRIRRQRNMGQQLAADKANIHAVSLCRLETGAHFVTPWQLTNLARVYGCSIQSLAQCSRNALT